MKEIRENLLARFGLGLVFLIFMFAISGVLLTLFSGFFLSTQIYGASQSISVSSTLSISNAAPLVSNVVLNGNSEIVLTAYATTSISVSAQLTDYNGCDGILNGTTTVMIFRSGITSSTCLSSANNLNCYQRTTFTATSSCQNDISLDATTTFDVYYFADATDASSSYESQNWIANVSLTDSSGTVATGENFDSAGVELLSLTAIEVGSSSIDYGTLNPSSTSGGANQILPVINAGNSSSTMGVHGTAMTLSPNSIATSSQHYATSSFYFGGNEQQLSAAATTISGMTLLPRISLMNDLGSWENTTALPNSVKNAGYTNNASYLYVTGGQTTTTVRFASFNSDGTINSWTETAPLNQAQLGHAALIFNEYIYSIAGSNVNKIYYAPISATGSIASWSQTDSPDSLERYYFPAVAYKGYLYIFGGFGGGDIENSQVFYAPFDSDGSFGSWALATSIPNVLSHSTAVAYNDYVYVIGGEKSTIATSTVIFASVNSDGSLGSWTNTTALPAARTDLGAVVEDGYVYVLGGGTSTVIYAPFNSDGTIGSWTNVTSLPSSQGAMAAEVNKGYLYGLPNAGSTSTVLYTQINNAQTQQETFWGLEIPQYTPPGAYSGVNTFVASYVP